MSNYGVAEQYGLPCTDLREEAWGQRKLAQCPFVGSNCTKTGGVCSISDGENRSIVCPNRFREDGLLFQTVAEIAFGTTENCLAISEVPFLLSETGKNVGNIDNVVIRYEDDQVADWCALEVQAVYFSGASMTSEIREYESTRRLPKAGSRRPDFRSSGPKRLLPQLETKIPTLRRWGKKVFVAVDQPFFEWMPTTECVNDFETLVFGI